MPIPLPARWILPGCQYHPHIYRIRSSPILPFAHSSSSEEASLSSSTSGILGGPTLLFIGTQTSYNSLLPFVALTSPCLTSFFVSCSSGLLSSMTCIAFLAPFPTITWVILRHQKCFGHPVRLSLTSWSWINCFILWMKEPRLGETDLL